MRPTLTAKVAPPESAEDREGNGLGAVFSWTEWHECDDSPDSSHVLTCGTCGGEIERCEYAPEVPGSRWIETGHDPEAEDRAYLERPTDIDLYA